MLKTALMTENDSRKIKKNIIVNDADKWIDAGEWTPENHIAFAMYACRKIDNMCISNTYTASFAYTVHGIYGTQATYIYLLKIQTRTNACVRVTNSGI